MTDLPQLLRRRDLLSTGYDDHLIGARHRSDAWVRVRAGVYAAGDQWRDATPEDRHRLTIAATAERTGDHHVLSHTSAAIWHGLAIVGSPPDLVHMTRQSTAGGFRRGNLHSHVGVLEEAEIVELDGVRVTSVERTLWDCARTMSFPASVVLADHALRAKATSLPAMGELIDHHRTRRGRQRVERVVAFADERSASPGESVSRVRIAEFGLPTPVLQRDALDPGGSFVGRPDFWWTACGTVGEFDGHEKYVRYLLPGETIADAVIREKRREDKLRELGLEVVRWEWRDLFAFHAVAERLQRAFARAERRTPSGIILPAN